ncbi:hypothetical protein C8Q74DRAFT_1230296 [Fomes fomentarius]|nr:hypothetical protein C8Q74DRAFT_1230296 [Fomes fomentarius]
MRGTPTCRHVGCLYFGMPSLMMPKIIYYVERMVTMKLDEDGALKDVGIHPALKGCNLLLAKLAPNPAGNVIV